MPFVQKSWEIHRFLYYVYFSNNFMENFKSYNINTYSVHENDRGYNNVTY